MQTRSLGKSGIEVSVVGLGTMSWPGCRYGNEGYEPTAEERSAVREMVGAALDAGVNLMDTAEGYGRGLAETMLGEALAELGRRDEAIVVSKVGPLFAYEQKDGRTCDLSAASIRRRCEASLKRLGTGHIDVYLAHWPDAQTPIEETMAAMDKLKGQGKIRAFGVSNFGVDLLNDALRFGGIAANQLPYSLLDRDIDAEQRSFCIEQEIGIMAYSPLGKGMLTGKYNATHLPPPDDYRHQRRHFAKENLERHFELVRRLGELGASLNCTAPQLALAWVLARPGVSVILPGAKSPDQVRTNTQAAEVVVPADILKELERLSDLATNP